MSRDPTPANGEVRTKAGDSGLVQTLILGGGFGGIATANTLRRLLPPEHAIMVIDEYSRFHVGAGKPWVMLGERTSAEISAERAVLLEPGSSFSSRRSCSWICRADVSPRRPARGGGTFLWFADKLFWVARHLEPRRQLPATLKPIDP